MKTKLATVMFSLAAALGFAEEAPINQPSTTLLTEVRTAEKAVFKKSFSYVRMGISDKDAIHTVETIPGLGVGYRHAMVNSAIDVSANYTSQVVDQKLNDTYFYTVPKVSYLRYISEDFKPESFYYGAGLAWGGVKKAVDNTFTGFIPSATVGYEMNRNQTWHSFVQLDVSQPVAATVASWSAPLSFSNLPGPLAEVSVGFGY